MVYYNPHITGCIIPYIPFPGANLVSGTGVFWGDSMLRFSFFQLEEIIVVICSSQLQFDNKKSQWLLFAVC